jgi:uncharacterized protein (TIGR02145 family)
MAENLNYNATGSICYGDDTGGDSQDMCSTYGRLYNWATAMGFESSCNSSYCSSQIQQKHKGICPSGWHIPSDAEWTTLTDYIGDFSGTKLKAVSGGWLNSYGVSGNGEDNYGFSALPGGSGSPDGNYFSDVYFENVGLAGFWWSASGFEYVDGSENDRFAYYWYMSNSYKSKDTYRGGSGKLGLFSVRCLQD